MIAKTRFTLTAVAVFVAFAFSAVMTVPAFADDSAPPPPVDTPTEVVPPVDEPAVVDAAPTEVPAPTEAAPTDVAPTEAAPAEAAPADVAPTDAAPTEAAPADVAPVDATTVTDVLAQAPEGTDVQVLDANGDALPLASQEAADTVATGDPIWCPSTVVTPVSGGSGCTASFTSFQALLDYLQLNQFSEAGTIWIEKNYDSSVNDVPSSSFTLDGGAGLLDIMANYALTIKGGWNGLGTNTIDVNDPSEFKGDALNIINWKANVSLSDILVNGHTSNLLGNDSALLVTTSGNINLTRVTVKDSINNNPAAGAVMTGATLDNHSSGAAGSTVIVNNGIFEKNEGYGLHITSAGVVTLTNIIADLNTINDGVYVDNSTYATMDRAVTLSGTQEYHNNDSGAGITILSRGFVTIGNVIADGNGDDGVFIDNRSSFTNQGVTVAGTNTFNDNQNGLTVLSHGVITTSNIYASKNGGDGAHLDNCGALGGACDVVGAPLVNVTGNNDFYNNLGDGLYIATFGRIYTNNVTASNNGGNGARLTNSELSLGGLESYGPITMNGYNVFNNNVDDGLNVTTTSDLIAYNVTANLNGNDGAELTANRTLPYTYPYVARIKVKGKYKNVVLYATINTANITLVGASNFVGNTTGRGLFASADGSITLYGITANFNGNDSVDHGAQLTTTTDGYGITLYNTNYFIGNFGSGLLATSKGAVTVYNVVANDNKTLGDGVKIDNRGSLANLGVNIFGANNMFNGNNNGLNVLSHGAITTYNLSASDNRADGVHLDNCDVISTNCSVVGAPYVNLVGNNYFNSNDLDGLDVLSFGQIYTNNLMSLNNLKNGALLNNQKFNAALAESAGAIAMTGYNIFNNNFDDGLNASSSYGISAYNITANDNYNDGAELTANKTTPYTYPYRVKVKVKGKYKYVTYYATVTAANISLYGVNDFDRNSRGTGLKVSTDGAITVYNLTANGNGHGIPNNVDGNGATLDNCGACTGTEVYPVTVYGYVNVSDNETHGLEINSLGAVTLSNIIASGNTLAGARINNKFNPSINPAVVRGVTITGTNTFNNNDSTGLVVLSYGAITLTNINAYYNGDSTPGSSSGVYLDNSLTRGDSLNPEGLIAAKNITITGVNSFVGNYFWGLEFHSNGFVSLSRISANGNDYGSPADGNVGGGVKGTAQSITLTCGHMFGNGNADLAAGYDLRVGLAANGTALAVPGVLTLNGIYSAGNKGTDVNVSTAGTSVAGSTQVITQACAFP